MVASTTHSPAQSHAVTVAAAPAKPARANVATQIEIHDHHQLEIRLSYAVGGDRRAQRYVVDTYFFVPRNVGVNRHNFSREQFYGDVTSFVRLDAAALPLSQLADQSCAASPLRRFAEALERFKNEKRPPSSRPVVAHIKLYAYLFARGVKAALQPLTRRLRAGAPLAEHAELERRFDRALADVRRALAAYRSVRAAFWPFERIAHHALADAMRVADEYMSLFLEERLAMIAQVNDDGPGARDGSGLACRLRLRLHAMADEETSYRRRYGYLTLTEKNLADGEYFTYRASLLKKTVQQALYLNPRQSESDRFTRNAIGAVGAALAAIWALAAQLPATLANASGTTKLLVFVVPVLAYVLKDRIKALTNEALSKRLRRYDHVSWLTGESLAMFGLGMLRARFAEAMRFLTSDEVPDDIMAVRLTGRTVPNAEAATEEVIEYRKVIDVSAKDDVPVPEGYRVRDSLRLNVRHFLVRLDDPLDSVAYYDAAIGRFAVAELPKVYHLNVVAKIRQAGGEGNEDARIERLRVVLNKDRIVRVDQVAVRAHAGAG